jgi:hypothetical protein
VSPTVAAPHRGWRLALGAIVAQVGAETRTRLRSTGTVFTVLLLFAAAFYYVPPPGSNRVSIMWHVGDEYFSGTYTISFVGAVVAMLTAMVLPLVGFYLVTGSVRRDLERRVWPIVAATPTSPALYLLGKWLAASAYLLVMAALGLVPAAILFAQHGVGPFDVVELVVPWLLLVPPAMLFTAALALLFDVTPVLRGRGGYVLWFFAWTILLMMIPSLLGRTLDQDPSNDRHPLYDPGGMVFFSRTIAESVDRPVTALSLGVILTDQRVERVPLPPLRADAAKVARRVLAAAWSVVPLLLATAMFRLSRDWVPRPGLLRRLLTRASPPAASPVAGGAEGARLTAPTTHRGNPSFARSLLADLLLTWKTASLVKWPLLALALLAALIPGDGASAVLAGFLLLLAPVIAEVAAREQLAGTGSIVFAQPGVPRSVLGWKLAVTAVFVALLGTPAVLRAFLAAGPLRGGTLLLALIFVATAATGLGWLTRGGKLFLGAFTALWYLAIQRDSPLDFTGAFSNEPKVALAAGFAAAGLLLVAMAAVEERLRGRRG